MTESDSHFPLPFPDVSASLPLEQQTVLRTLPENEITSWALVQVEVLQKHISNVRRLHNATLPIHRLPNELLMRIFVYACDRREDVRAAYVCSRWHAVLFATYEFWANALSNARSLRLHKLFSDRDKLFLRMALACSGSLPIKLYIADATPSALDVLAPYHRRIVDFTMGLAPGPRSETTPLTWKEAVTLTDLHHLAIDCTFLSSTSRLAEILSKCPVLCKLSLLEKPLFSPPPAVHPGEIVDLPKLNKVIVENVVILWDTLMLLRSPPPIAIVLETPQHQVGLNHAISPDFPGFHSPPFIDRLSIVEDNPPHLNRCTISGDVISQRRFQARLYMDSVYDISESISAFKQDPELATLTVGMGSSLYSVHSSNQRNAWLFFLASLWDLTRLELLRSSSLEVKVGFASWFLRCHIPARGGPDGEQDDGDVVLAPRKPLALAWEFPIASELTEAAGELSGLKKILSGMTEEGAKVCVHRLEIYGLPDAKKPPLEDVRDEISTGVVEGETALSSLLRDLREMVDELVVFASSIVVSITLR